jgi:hypothetical protein
MRKSERTFDKILQAFVESVAIGEFDTAEGWLAVAVWSRGIAEKSVPAPAP